MSLEAWAQNSNSVTSTAFCWSEKVTRPPQIQGVEKQGRVGNSYGKTYGDRKG